MKVTAKQHRLRRVLRKNQNQIDAMGRDARKEINKYNELTITGRSCGAMKIAKGLQVYTPDGTRYGKIQFWGHTYEPFN
tara:strand:+ start:9 stop:245 length:237 start_codon:yes stop_codon:yes gene_type:complete